LDDKNDVNERRINSQTIIAHEFRTPLSTMLMFLQNLIITEKLTTPTRQVLTIIVSQINLLSSLINDQLDIKLMEEGRFEAKMEVFKPQNVLNFIVAMF
jgi:signal transduction histidine kinase